MYDFTKKHICQIMSAVGAVFFLMILFIAVCSLSFLTVFAAGTATVTASIPVFVNVSGEDGTIEGTTENYTFRLTALNGAPVLENDTVTICGAGSAEFSVEYDKVGVYQYTLTQEFSVVSSEAGSEGQTGESYDDTVYYVTVTVQNTEDGGIGVTVSAHNGSTEGDKCEIEFENIIAAEPEASAEESAEKSTEETLEESTEEASEMDLTEISTESNTAEISAESDAPQTGDDTPVGFLGVLIIASLWLEFLTVFTRIRKIHK